MSWQSSHDQGDDSPYVSLSVGLDRKRRRGRTWDAMTVVHGAESSSRYAMGSTSSPCGIASAPPGRKSTWISTSRSAAICFPDQTGLALTGAPGERWGLREWEEEGRIEDFVDRDS